MQALQGKRIVNTRASHQAAALDSLLLDVGAESIAYPCITIKPPQDTSAFDKALQELTLGYFDWLVLTSANTVFSLVERLQTLNLSLGDAKFKTAAVGTSTAKAANEQLGLSIDLLPEEFIAESLADALKIATEQRALLPESLIARPKLAHLLQEAGIDLHVVKAYQTVKGAGGAKLIPLLQNRKIDAITFTSSSTVQYFVERLRDEGGKDDLLADVALAHIGPKTAKTAQELGLDASIMAQEYTLRGMLYVLDEHFLKRQELSEIE